MSYAADGEHGAGKWRRWALLGTVVVIVAVGGLLYHQHATKVAASRKQGEAQVDVLFRLLTGRGYLANRGLSGGLLPGTILQTHEAGPDAVDVPIDPPVTMFWSGRCFPGAAVHDTSFALPDRQGSSHSSISLGADGVRQMFPTLALQNTAMVDFGLRISDPRLRVVAKGDISGKMDPDCVKGLAAEMAAKAKVEWFAVVIEAITASRLTFHVTWSTSASASERLGVRTELAGALSRAASVPDGGLASATLVQDGRDETVLEISDVTIGYRLRRLEPIWPSVGTKATARADLSENQPR